MRYCGSDLSVFINMHLTPVNVALSVFAEMPPYLREAIETGLFAESVDAPG